MWNSPLPAPALLPMMFCTRCGTFSVMNFSFSSSTSACELSTNSVSDCSHVRARGRIAQLCGRSHWCPAYVMRRPPALQKPLPAVQRGPPHCRARGWQAPGWPGPASRTAGWPCCLDCRSRHCACMLKRWNQSAVRIVDHQTLPKGSILADCRMPHRPEVTRAAVLVD